MKVQGPHGNRPISLDAVRQRQQKNAGEVSSGDRTSKSSDPVEVSSSAKTLMAARAPEVPDQERIERLKDAIRNGTFEINYDRIADKIMQEELL